MQGLLADADGRVGPDRVEPEVVRDVLRERDRDGQVVALGIARGELQGPLVDVDGPDLGGRPVRRQGERDRAPAAAEVQHAGGRGVGGGGLVVEQVQQVAGRVVEPVAGEHAGRRSHRQASAGQLDLDLAQARLDPGGPGEVVVGHRSSLSQQCSKT